MGRPRPISRPWSRTGENPPYGILGATMETSASFEARSAPSSYPTDGDPYGRLVCKVLLLSGEDIDLDQFRAGMAWRPPVVFNAPRKRSRASHKRMFQQHGWRWKSSDFCHG